MHGWAPVCERHVDPLDAGTRAGHQGGDELNAGGGEGEHGAVVDGVGVAVEQPCAAEGTGDRRDRLLVTPFGEVGDRERHSAQTSSSPPRRIGSPSILSSGSNTTQSRWTGTWMVPPIAAEAPKAT